MGEGLEKKIFEAIKMLYFKLGVFLKWRTSGFGSKYQLLNMF